MEYYEKNLKEIAFDTKSGRLSVIKKGELYEMDFPAYQLEPVKISDEMIEAIGAEPSEAYMGRDLLCIFDDEDTVRNLSPEMEKIKKLPGLLLQVTAKGEKFDCVSRSFAPKLNVAEDPVCGSGHCHIVPYWAGMTGKEDIVAYQASERGGILYCSMDKDRVKLSGNVSLYSIGEIFV